MNFPIKGHTRSLRWGYFICVCIFNQSWAYATTVATVCDSYRITSGLGIRSFAHRSFAHFAQNKWATVSDSLRLLKTNKRPWANRSGLSEEMSDRERITQVAQKKWATMSDSLRLLRGNEQMSDSLKKCWLQ